MVVLCLLSGGILTALYGLVQECGKVGWSIQLYLTQGIVIGIQYTLREWGTCSIYNHMYTSNTHCTQTHTHLYSIHVRIVEGEREAMRHITIRRYSSTKPKCRDELVTIIGCQHTGHTLDGLDILIVLLFTKKGNDTIVYCEYLKKVVGSFVSKLSRRLTEVSVSYSLSMDCCNAVMMSPGAFHWTPVYVIQ